MYNVVNKKCTNNYLSTQCRIQFTVQCFVQKKSVKKVHSTFKGVKEQFFLRLFRVTFKVQLKVQYIGKYLAQCTVNSTKKCRLNFIEKK